MKKKKQMKMIGDFYTSNRSVQSYLDNAWERITAVAA